MLNWIRAVLKKKSAVFSTALVVLGICLLIYAGYTRFFAHPTPQRQEERPISSSLDASDSQSSSEESTPSSTTSQPESSLPKTEEIPMYPTDQLFLTKSRQNYWDGDLVLRIPRLDLETPVMDGTDEESLKNGVGLYEYAQLPGENNCNVSIAGHRDIYGCEFYYIDQITDGDLLYLVDQTTVYTYQYKQTDIVEADDWGPIYCKDYSCLTLTSCHPIGTSQKRIIVTAELISSAVL